ncbi:piwi-like protein 1 [Acanthaster planci]|uniref:Piwi-like protein 1 n=1 Tax=Acanthaster planci TaxID=133434 RepID=A0A8B8A4U3_ACAPL|nr:piwi-like protein 1 [Acanthaster planci]XP_022111925.1 piwi-like protein 1 [Acanthaster planci]XP_022111935.1 piwi-like protein 1 [Acanthaster planci]XP_022111945.1 piwi-like protein 1 [Acanthaster planci]
MSGSGPPGLGRGGRGAALMAVLQNPIRRPGQEPSASSTSGHSPPERASPSPPSSESAGPGVAARVQQQNGHSGARPSQSGEGAATKPQPSVGRGLASLYQQMQLSRGNSPVSSGSSSPSSGAVTPSGTPTPPSTGTGTPPAKPFGRGIAGLSARGSPTAVPAFGRGIAGLKQKSPPLAQTPAESSPHSPLASPTSPQGTGTTTPQLQPQAAASAVRDKPEVQVNIPPPGTSGAPIKVATNYLPIKFETEAIWQYAVSFSPHIESKKMRMGLLYTYLDNISKVRAFDGTILFLPVQLKEKVTIFKTKGLRDNTEFEVKIQLAKALQPKDCIQLYNVIFRRIMRILSMSQVGRHYYSPDLATMIPQHKLEIWPGYVTAIHEYSSGLMLQLDVSHKVLCYQTVLDTMTEIYRRNEDTFKDECTRQIVGTIVLTRYNNQTYRVDDIAWNKNPLSTFMYHDKEEMTFVEYYKKHYDKEITDMGQPLLINRPKKEQLKKPGSKASVICLVPELACRTGLTDEMRSDFRVMKDLAFHTRITPAQRHVSLRKFIDNIYQNRDALKELTNWGMSVDRDILTMGARQLRPEQIRMQNNTIVANPEADWGREMTRDRATLPVDLNHWLLVFCKRDASRSSDFLKMMERCCPQLGIRIQPPVRFQLQDDKTQTYLNCIRDAINPQLQLVVIIFPTSRDDRYSAVKKLCCVEKAIPSQVIISRTISQQQKLRSVTQKIALQINCKLGGELWSLDIPVSKMMVVGIDVYHDPARGGKSIGAFVASTNKLLTRWYSRVCFQTPQQELIDGLKLCLVASIKKYHEINHDLPQKIVIFRDGVGDGQLNIVATYEQQQLSACFEMFGETYKPSLTIVIVQKRINTRIFAASNGRQLENPAPGCVVDHTITRLNWYDFFLVSQHVRQGTVTPTHYVVVYDTSKFNADQMQRLAYKLTHLYYNWPGTVRVPAPCQYAHKLAYLVGESLKREPALELSDRLFFL